MNTEFYNELKANDKEEKNTYSLNELAHLTQEKINKAKKIENYIPIITTFYSYVKENYESHKDVYKKAYSPWVVKYYTKEKIKEKFDDLVSDSKYLNIIVELGSDELYKNLSEVASEKVKEDDKYKSSYDNIKSAFIINNVDPKYFTDVELKMEENISDSAKDLISKIDSVNTISSVKPVEAPVLDNSSINEYEKMANNAIDKINNIVSERNVELQENDKTKEKKEEPKENNTSYDFSKFDDNYSSIKSMADNLDKKEQELIEKQNIINMERKRIERLEQRRENEMVLNASDDLGVSKEKLDNAISKSGIDLKDVDKIVISKEMLDMAANGYVASLPKNKFSNFIENVARGSKLRKSDFTVENLDGVNVLKINSNDAVSKIASCEQKLFNKISAAAKKKASLKDKIISFAGKSKEEIISLINYARDKVSDKLYHMAGKISPADYRSYDVSDRPPIPGFDGNYHKNDDEDKEKQDMEDIIKKIDEKRNSPEEKEITSILDEVNERKEPSETKKVDDNEIDAILNSLKNNKTYASSGTFVGNVEAKEEEIHKSM